MTDFLLKRLLLIIPTFVGVSLVIWLVMALSPGEPSGPGAGGSTLSGDTPQNLQDLESQNRNVRMFRRQFNLDRPRFWNDWTSLPKEDVREALETVVAGIGPRTPAEVKAAKRQLDDWSTYAIPALVDLLGETQGDLQTKALQTLRQAAYRFRTIYKAGYKPTDEERQRDREIDISNRLVNSPEFSWAPDASPEERAAVVARWQAWFMERQDRWEWSFWERMGIGLTDTQFGKYWGNLARRDLGQSNRTNQPVLEMILGRLKYSLTMVVPAFLLAWFLAILLGVFGATRHGSAMDQATGVFVFLLYSIPSFVAATVLQRILAIKLGWFPQDGFESPNAAGLDTWAHIKDIAWHVTLPIACYAYAIIAYTSRQARSGMLQVLRADYIRTARAKGLPERTVVWRHAVRNGMMPLVTLLGAALPVLLGGSVIIEYVFNIDGFGKLMIDSIFQKDYNVVMGIALISAILTLLGLLLTDLIYASMDPRISLK